MRLFSLLVLAICSLVTYSQTTEIDPNTNSGVVAINMTEALLHQNLTSYVPSAVVQAFHNLPHWDPQMSTIEDPEFKAGFAQGVHAYYKSLIGFPILLFVIGCIALLLLQV